MKTYSKHISLTQVFPKAKNCREQQIFFFCFYPKNFKLLLDVNKRKILIDPINFLCVSSKNIDVINMFLDGPGLIFMALPFTEVFLLFLIIFIWGPFLNVLIQKWKFVHWTPMIVGMKLGIWYFKCLPKWTLYPSLDHPEVFYGKLLVTYPPTFFERKLFSWYVR